MNRFLLVAMACVGGWTAQAAAFTLTFTALMTPATPQSPISGTFKWNAPTITDAATAFTLVNLIIDGHSYGTGDVGMFANATEAGIGGNASGAGGIALAGSTPDFLIVWTHQGPSPLNFIFNTAQSQAAIAGTTAFTQFSLTEDVAGVPEPGSLGMVALGGLVLGGIAARKKR